MPFFNTLTFLRLAQHWGWNPVCSTSRALTPTVMSPGRRGWDFQPGILTCFWSTCHLRIWACRSRFAAQTGWLGGVSSSWNLNYLNIKNLVVFFFGLGLFCFALRAGQSKPWNSGWSWWSNLSLSLTWVASKTKLIYLCGKEWVRMPKKKKWEISKVEPWWC